MNKLNHNQSGFSAVVLVLAVVVICAVAGAGWFVISRNNKPATVVTDTSSNKTTPDSSLKSGTLKYEKISYKYPATWSLEDKPGSDHTILTAKNGLKVGLRTGIGGIGGGSAQSTGDTVKLLGKTYNLGYGYDPFDESAPDPKVDKVSGLSVIEDGNFFLKGKNIDYGSEKALMTFEIYYAQDNKEVSVGEFKKDPYYIEAVAILESLTYE